MTVTRRSIIKVGAGFLFAAASGGAYARYVEPGGSLALTRHALAPRGWTPGLKLRIVALADLHCGGAHMPLARIQEIVEITHSLEPDVVVLLGDYVTRANRNVHDLSPKTWSQALGKLKAPLGVHSILGNHEFWDDPVVQRRGYGDPFGKLALLDAGLPVLENQAVRLSKAGQAFWLAGLADQIAFNIGYDRERGGLFRGLHDLPATFAQVSDNAPVILLAHEPDIFAKMPLRTDTANLVLTLAGHTHGGQIRIFGWSPYIPSEYGRRYAYGHIVEDGQSMIVSAGLGTSGPPVRFGVPPEIVVVDLG
ncbi:MAG: metallophosphoesterase [Bosea sp. (in: a-proteobacteria)]